MKKIFLLIIALFLSIFIVNPSYAQQMSKYGYPTGNQNSSNTYGNWYLVVGVGYAHIIGLKSDINQLGNNLQTIDPDLSGSISSTISTVGTNLDFGYSFNKFLSLQTGFDWLGNYKFKLNLDDTVHNFYINETVNAYIYTIPIKAVVSYPFNDGFAVFGAVGGDFWFVNESGSVSSNIPGVNGTASQNKTGIAPVYSIGIRLRPVKSAWGLKLEYNYFQNLFNSNQTIYKSHYNVEELALLGEYRF